VRPPALTGREAIIREFEVAIHRLERGRSATTPLITGPRGSGKTVLVNHLLAGAREQGWYTASEEVIPGVPLPRLVAVLAHEVLLQMSGRHRAQERVRRALGVLKAFTSVSAFGIELNIDAENVSGTADSGMFERDLRQLFIEIGEVAKLQSSGVLIALDEMHALGEDGLGALYSALHQTAQRDLPVALLSAGLFPSWQSGAERVDPTRVSSYPARMMTRSYVRLEPLNPTEATELLTRTADTQGVTWSNVALRVASNFCEGNPWVLQMVGSASWDAAPGPTIDERAASSACAQVDQQLAQWFFPRLLRSCTGDQLRLLRQIAEFDAWLVPVGQVTDRSDFEADRRARHLLSELARNDLVSFTNVDQAGLSPYLMSIRFSVPRLRQYLRAVVL
jgi:hypothetical protein